MTTKIALTFLVGVFALLSFAHCRSVNSLNSKGAIRTKVTENGFVAINSLVEKSLVAELRQISLMDIVGSKNRVDYKIQNIRMEHVSVKSSRITPTQSGLLWQAKLDEILISADYMLESQSGQNSNGRFVAWVKNQGFQVNVQPRIQHGQLAAFPEDYVPSDCLRTQQPEVTIERSEQQNEEETLVSGELLRQLKLQIPAKICSAAGKVLHKWSVDIFPMKKRSDILITDKIFKANYDLVDLQHEDGFMNLEFLGEILPYDDSISELPLTLPPFPSTGMNKHYYSTITDFTANSLLYSLHTKGVGRWSFPAATVAGVPVVRSLFTNLCDGVTACDSSAASFSMDVLDVPKMRFDGVEHKMSLEVNKTQIKIFGQVNGEFDVMATVLLNATISVEPYLTHDLGKVFLRFSSGQIRFDSIQTSVLNTKQQEIRNLLRQMARHWTLRALNQYGFKGFEIPHMERPLIPLGEREILIEDNVMIISGKFWPLGARP